jgi:uncharacterized Zn-binding protein involved in type VI secretion
MAGVVRQGDPNINGGLAVFPVAMSVTVNGRPVATVGTVVTSHPPCSPQQPQHCKSLIPLGSFTVLAEGKPISYVGLPDMCGCPRVLGSFDVLVGQ